MSHCLVQGILYLFKQLFIGIKSHIGKSDVLICFQKCNVVFRQVFVGQRTFRSADNISVSRLCPQESGNAYGIGEQIVACSVFLSDGKSYPMESRYAIASIPVCVLYGFSYWILSLA